MSLFHLKLETLAAPRDEPLSDPPRPKIRYRATAQAPDGSRASEESELDRSKLENLLQHLPAAVLAAAAKARRVVPAEEKLVRRLGGGLFGSLPEEVRALLTESFRHAELAGRPLTVALQADPDLTRLPWELLFSRTDDDYPFLHHHLVRELPAGRTDPALRLRGKLNILGMVGYSRHLDDGQEREKIRTALAPLVHAGEVKLAWVEGHTWDALQQQVESEDWHIVHVIGHGSFDREGAILLANDDGSRRTVAASDFALAFRGQPSIRLVVLNCCQGGQADPRDRFSSVAAELVRRGIPAVVAMQLEITDRAAIEFSRSFYGSLARQRSVEASVTAFRKDVRIAMRGSLEYGTPVLYMDTPGRPVFDVWRPELVKTIEAPASVNAVAFSPDGRRLVLACDGRAPWLLPTSTWDGPLPRRAFARTPYAVAFHPGEGWFATAHRDRAVRRWSGEPGGEATAVLSYPDWVGEVAFSPDGGFFATAGGDGQTRLYRVGTSQSRMAELPPLRHPDPVRSVAFHPARDWIATACDDKIARIWSMDGEELLPIRHHAPVIGVAFSPDGRLLATACDDGYARTWRFSTDDRSADQIGEFHHRDGVLCVAFSPDGRRLATASRDHTARIWEVITGDQLTRIQHDRLVRRVTFSPDGHRLATASYDRTCQVWQVAEQARVEMWLHPQVSIDDVTELRESLQALRLVPDALGQAAPRRSMGVDPWLVLIVVRLTEFLGAIDRLDNAAFDRLVRVIRKLLRRHSVAGREHELRLRDDETDVVIVLAADLPDEAYRKLRRLDPTGFPRRSLVRYDRELGEWRSVPEEGDPD